MDSLYNSNNELIIKPKNDVIFKKLFIENEDLLQDLVASIMGVPYDSIKELTVLNNEMPVENANAKRCTLDLRLSVNGDPFSIEIHLTDDNYFIDRSVFYWVKLSITPLKSGQVYTLLRKTVSVNIVDYTMYPYFRKNVHFMPFYCISYHFYLQIVLIMVTFVCCNDFKNMIS